jgi:hypothetical protein
MGLKAFCDRQWHKTGIDVYLIKHDHEGKPTHVGEPIGFRPIKENESRNEGDSSSPTFFLDCNDAQCLMDALYQQGLRPTEAMRVDEVLQATNKHIVDLQKFAFCLLDFVTKEPAKECSKP